MNENTDLPRRLRFRGERRGERCSEASDEGATVGPSLGPPAGEMLAPDEYVGKVRRCHKTTAAGDGI
jgi:hypothetical protein